MWVCVCVPFEYSDTPYIYVCILIHVKPRRDRFHLLGNAVKNATRSILVSERKSRPTISDNRYRSSRRPRGETRADMEFLLKTKMGMSERRRRNGKGEWRRGFASCVTRDFYRLKESRNSFAVLALAQPASQTRDRARAFSDFACDFSLSSRSPGVPTVRNSTVRFVLLPHPRSCRRDFPALFCRAMGKVHVTQGETNTWSL